jgi:putative FmdB family regulatory protein
MPIFEFQCKKCSERYDVLVKKSDPTGKYPGVRCPACNSVSKKQQISLCSFSFKDPVGTDRYRNDHDYRAKHRMPSAMAEREAAMKKATDETGYVGKRPYKDFDDLNKNNFGEVK